jgi:Carboxypeptidase regulatory-like domain
MIATAFVGPMLFVTPLLAQQSRGTLRGVVKDELGGLVPGATVTLTSANGEPKTATANSDGEFVFDGLAPGKYNASAVAKGFAATEQSPIEVAANRANTLEFSLKVAIAEQSVTVNSEQPISVEATANGNQTVVAGKDLDILPDNPDELAAALQALAGPPVGPSTGEIYVDGFAKFASTRIRSPRKTISLRRAQTF